jgi:hypothetical protein
MNNNMYKIKVGISTSGDVLEDYKRAMACNLCTNFKPYGLHACSGHCNKRGIDIEGGYTGNYSRTARQCESFESKKELLVKI